MAQIYLPRESKVAKKTVDGEANNTKKEAERGSENLLHWPPTDEITEGSPGINNAVSRVTPRT